MKRTEKIHRKFDSLLFNHLWLKFIFDYGIAFVASIASAAIFAFGLNVFLKPGASFGTEGIHDLVSGGSSGLSQVITLALYELGFRAISTNTLISILYLAINIPLLILAFKGVGKRFAIFSLVNVLCVSIFNIVFATADFKAISDFVSAQGGLLGRALFAGLCTGLSSAIAFKVDSSAGGFDIVSYYVSIRKSTKVGPISAIINGTIICAYAILTSISESGDFASCVGGAFFSIVYLFIATIVIDLINVRNNKAQVEIITNKENVSELLLAHIPHGATQLCGKGVYSGKDRFIIHMIVSVNEVKKVVNVAKQLDPDCFINVTQLQQVYGRFHMKAIK